MREILLAISSFCLLSCGSNFSPKKQIVFNASKVNAEEFSINSLPPTENFYHTESISDSLFFNYRLTDSIGILMKEYGDSIYYHPIQITQNAIYFLSSYQNTQKKVYLDLAKKYAEKLIEMSDNYENTLLFPYEFDFPLHGNKDLTMKAPWYSGMAQGQILSLFSKLYAITNEDKYLQYADLTYNSFFLDFDDNQMNNIKISTVDENAYLWIEEYPIGPANYTLNGFLFAILGLYDYYLVKPENKVYELLCATLTTAKYNIPRFRVKNDVSYYCIAHKVQAENYHAIHIKQIDFLYKMTFDEEFKKQSEQLSEDYPIQ